ncbi:MAG TPA: DUF362 domain-containing protein [Bacillota bacterium]|nr:DUF362 domain-containing protein [Bacillota bacterium]HQI16523.1 DUF362 domain-containing protein [Bacillota bacterium]HQJ37689.1 DUF362 domain-containing protein [Bacillota bacterium]
MNTVSIVKCDDYEFNNVKRAVYEALDGIENIKLKIIKGSRVLIKTNLLMRKNPEDAVTTHPAVVEAVVRYLQDIDCKVIIGDSPGGPFTEWNLKSVYKAAGMFGVAERTGCELNFDTSVLEISNSGAKRLKSMQIIRIAKEVDFVVSAAKLKTHGMMTYTGAVKNLFGVIPGLVKADYHLRLNNADNFADHLVDICETVKPVFSIIDGIDGMEGDGPSAGEKRHAGLILASENPYALDTAASSIIGIEPVTVPTIRAASSRNLFSGDLKDIDIKGVRLDEIRIEPFKLPKSHNANLIGGRVPKAFERMVLNTLRPKPVFNHEICISCGDCKRSCPPGIIDMSSGKPVPDLSKCIRCFCCHELCPKKAVDIKRHWLYDKVLKK